MKKLRTSLLMQTCALCCLLLILGGCVGKVVKGKVKENSLEQTKRISSDDDGCHSDQECVSILSCAPILDMLIEAKDDAEESPWRVNIVNVARQRICGQLSERTVCCPKHNRQPKVGNIILSPLYQ